MEKFGIFNLLAALSDFAVGTDARGGESAPDPARHAETESGSPARDGDAARRAAGAGALLERHAAISRRIDRRNGK